MAVVGVQHQPRGGEALGQLPPQLGDGSGGVRPGVLEHRVQAGVEGPLPPALHVGEKAAEAVVVLGAVLGRERAFPRAQRLDALALHVAEDILDEPVAPAYPVPGLRHVTSPTQ